MAGTWPPRTHIDSAGRQFRSGMQVLKDHQMAEFQEVRRRCAGAALPDAQRLSDEDLLLRHFVAAKFDADAAVAKLEANMAWRRAEGVEGVQRWCEEHIPEDTPRLTHTDGLIGYFGVDKEGFPVWWERPNAAGTAEFVNKHGVDAAMKWHVACVERLRELPKRLNVDRYTVVFDLKDASGSMLFGKVGVLMRAQAALDQAYYPEVMRRLIIINAPFGFSTSFGVIKKLLDQQVQDKICVGGRRGPGDILSMHVPDESIPTEFGGPAIVDWSRYGMRPSAAATLFENTSFFRGHVRTMYEMDRAFHKQPRDEEDAAVDPKPPAPAGKPKHPLRPRPGSMRGKYSDRQSCPQSDDLHTCLTVRTSEDPGTPSESPPPSFHLHVVAPTPVRAVADVSIASADALRCSVERRFPKLDAHDSDRAPLRGEVAQRRPCCCCAVM